MVLLGGIRAAFNKPGRWRGVPAVFHQTTPTCRVAEHPELLEINFAPDGAANWIHTNSIAHHPLLDQIVVSSRRLCEIWVIDHSTTNSSADCSTPKRQVVVAIYYHRIAHRYRRTITLPAEGPYRVRVIAKKDWQVVTDVTGVDVLSDESPPAAGLGSLAAE